MDDLVAWLRGVLDEDERLYRSAIGDWTEPEEWDSGDAVDDLHRWRWMLADIEAKRAILDLHAQETDGKGRDICDYCAQLCHSRSGLMCDDPDAPYPCATVKLLASAYRAWDGYREEWRP